MLTLDASAELRTLPQIPRRNSIEVAILAGGKGTLLAKETPVRSRKQPFWITGAALPVIAPGDPPCDNAGSHPASNALYEEEVARQLQNIGLVSSLNAIAR